MTWATAALGEVTEIVSGATPRTDVPAYWDGDVAWATPKDLSELDGALISVTPRMISQTGLRSCAAKVLPPGSVLFSSRAPIGHVAINTVPMATNQGFKSMVPKAGLLHAKYLYHWLKAHRSHLESLGNGATFKEVSKSVVERVEIPLPPIEEQRRIAAILDHADSLRLRNIASLKLIEEICHSLFHEFSDPQYSKVSLASAGWDFSTGKNLVAAEGSEDPRKRVIKVSAVSSGVFDPCESKPLPLGYEPPSRHAIRSGDILFGRASGSLSLLGATAVAQGDFHDLYLPDKVWRLELGSAESTLPRYALAVLRSGAFLAYVRQHASGAAGVRNIGKKTVLDYKLSMPPLSEQETLVSALARTDDERLAIQNRHERLDSLFTSLQARAFSGRL